MAQHVRFRVYDCTGYPAINNVLDAICDSEGKPLWEDIESDSATCIFALDTEKNESEFIRLVREKLRGKHRLVVSIPRRLWK